MKNIFSFFLALFLFFYLQSIYCHDQDVHKYITWHAWELVKQIHPEVTYSEMSAHIGHWQDGTLNHHTAWQTGNVLTGVYGEDEYDPVYFYNGFGGYLPTNTHFWDGWNDETYFHPFPWTIKYPNSYKKVTSYWDGKMHDRDGDHGDFLYTWYFGSGMQMYKYLLHYDNLADFYKHPGTHGKVSGWWQVGQSYSTSFYPPEPIDTWFYPSEVYLIRDHIIWEIVGRICHLIEDAGVPAHTHYDPHPTDVYEKDYMAPSNHNGSNHYLDYGFQDALNDGGLLDINNVSNKIRYLLYTTLAIARRFPSNDYWGVNEFAGSYNGDNYSQVLQPIFNEINSLNPPVPTEPGVSSLTAGRIARYAYVYSIRAIASFLWLIYNQFEIVREYPVAINNIVKNKPDNNVFWNERFRLTPQCTGTNPITYNWEYRKCGSFNSGCQNTSSLPNGISISSGLGNSFFEIANSYNETCPNNYNCFQSTNCTVNGQYPDCGNSQLNFTVKLTAYNRWNVSNPSSFQYSNPIYPRASFRPPPPGGGGCPYIYVWNSDSTLYMTDNNLLHRSEFVDFADQDITDKYKLQVQPNLINGKYSVQIGESENDHDYIDIIKLHAIDHPIGTKIGITESNDIIMYDNTNVTSTNNATQNGNNITQNIQYYYQGKLVVTGNTNDNIYAHFDSTNQMLAAKNFRKKYGSMLNNIIPDSMALIGEVDREYTPGKNWGGVATAFTSPNNPVERYFAARENLAQVIIPVASMSDKIDHVDINWNSDYSVTYFAVVPIAFSGFSDIEVPLSAAIHSVNNEDVTALLNNIDRNYAELDSSDYITIQFDSIPEPENGWIRDFVLETNGRYVVGGSVMKTPVTSNLINNSGTYSFNLHTNYPNPFNPKTVLKYEIGKNAFVTLSIYNVLGQLIYVPVNTFQSAGSYSVEFDGTNLPSGLYIYKIEAGNYIESKKMLLLK